MSGPDQYPPPGAPGGQWPAPGPAPGPGPGSPPTVGRPRSAGPPPSGHFHRPVPVLQRPGAVPLRPLGLGDILDSAVKIVRHNAGATIGASLVVGALAMAVPVVTTFLLWRITGLAGALDPMASTEGLETDGEIAAILATLVSWLAGFGVQYLGIVLVTGMIVQVTAAAAMGRKMTLTQAWAATAGKRWRLIGLVALLAVLVGVVFTAYLVLCVVVVVATESIALVVVWFFVTVPLMIVGTVWFWVKVSLLAPAVLVAEDTGVLASVVRAARLVKGHFWRIFGIALLVSIITQLVGGLLATPLSVLAVLPPLLGASPELSLLLSVGAQVLSVVLVTAITTPFLAATTALLHLDLRMRKEAYDVELMQRTGLEQR